MKFKKGDLVVLSNSFDKIQYIETYKKFGNKPRMIRAAEPGYEYPYIVYGVSFSFSPSELELHKCKYME